VSGGVAAGAVIVSTARLEGSRQLDEGRDVAIITGISAVGEPQLKPNKTKPKIEKFPDKPD